MKKRIYKQVIELGHWGFNFEIESSVWRVDKVIEDAEEVTLYLAEALKESTSFSCGVYTTEDFRRFCINYYFVEEKDYE